MRTSVLRTSVLREYCETIRPIGLWYPYTYSRLSRKERLTDSVFLTGYSFVSVVALARKDTMEVLVACFAPTGTARFTDGIEARAGQAPYVWPRNGTHGEFWKVLEKWVDRGESGLSTKIRSQYKKNELERIAGGFSIGIGTEPYDNLPSFTSRSVNGSDPEMPGWYRSSFCQAMADISGLKIETLQNQSFSPFPLRFKLHTIDAEDGEHAPLGLAFRTELN